MCWKECDRVSERREFVRLFEAGGSSMSELCRRFKVSRKTGYKWVHRVREEGFEGLEDRSRRPERSPHRTSDEVELAVVSLRRLHPHWGGRKLKQVLERGGELEVPSASSITRILHRHGLIDPSESEKHKAWIRFEHLRPNDLWQIDFKGDFLMSGGGRCYPLTLLDDHSRYSLGVFACDNQRGLTVKEHFRKVFNRYGIPKVIYADNGNPWGNTQDRTRHSRFGVWLMRQDIEVIHGRPYHPQGRGKLERFHRTLKLEVLQDRCFADLTSVGAAFDSWRDIYNHVRPHEALELEVPAHRYQASSRSFQEASGVYEYSSRFEVRSTNPTGQFSFKKKKYRISDAFTEQAIGLSPTLTDGVWDVYYCRFRIGCLSQHTGEIIYGRRLAESRSARFSQAAGGGNSPPIS